MSITSTIDARSARDIFRQVVNVILAFAMVITSYIGSITGANDRFANSDPATTAQIVPASYAFSIWGPIYLGSLAYAIYQALPRNRENELLRRIGFYTASAFLATNVWLFAAQRGLIWLTVVIMLWILFSLICAYGQIVQFQRKFRVVERVLVEIPFGLFTGWITVATAANIASSYRKSGFSSVLFPEQTWTILLLVCVGIIGSLVSLKSRTIWYGLTIVWALIGVMVANLVRLPNLPIAVVAGVMAACVAGTLVQVWVQPRVSSSSKA